jgi:glycosyltransferase involved in cell wall biosynthesis
MSLKELEKFKVLSKNSANDREFKFINVGRFTFQKAQEVLLKAVTLLVPIFEKFSLTLVGEGEEKENLLRYINTHNLEGFVRVENYREDILEYYSEFDSLVLSSRYEGIPYVMLESMAIGLPVIVTNVGGISNIITDKVNGIIVNEESPQNLCDAMLLLANDKKLYEKIKFNAFEKVNQFSIEKMAKDYIALYEHAVSNI